MGWKKELWPEWEIDSSIGSGAYGTVYKIKRQDIGGTYYSALKVISFPRNKRELNQLYNQNMTDSQIAKYYQQMAIEVSKEFAMMERLKGNTNIVSYEDHKIVPHKNNLGWDILIRMELLTPLSEYMKRYAINEKEACKLGIDICNALILCERENIIHRDIKPGNIFVSDFGDYKLGDFSIAKYIEQKIDNTVVQGTYAYMAPEVYNQKGYDFTIDIYSLGLILYQILNRMCRPFQPLSSEKPSLEILEIATQKRLNLQILPKPIDASSMMTSIILKACAYNPQKRYRNAEEFQKALQRCSSSQVAIEAKKQISNYIKKAAVAVQDSYEELFGEDVESEERTMRDFFSPPGDL